MNVSGFVRWLQVGGDVVWLSVPEADGLRSRCFAVSALALSLGVQLGTCIAREACFDVDAAVSQAGESLEVWGQLLDSLAELEQQLGQCVLDAGERGAQAAQGNGGME